MITSGQAGVGTGAPWTAAAARMPDSSAPWLHACRGEQYAALLVLHRVLGVHDPPHRHVGGGGAALDGLPDLTLYRRNGATVPAVRAETLVARLTPSVIMHGWYETARLVRPAPASVPA